MSRVIVAIDGSPTAYAALRFAAREAGMRDAVLEIVHVRAPVAPSIIPSDARYYPPETLELLRNEEVELLEDAEGRARVAADRLLAEAADEVDDHTRVETTPLVGHHPSRMLVDLVGQRPDTELFVVGSRGRGELTSAVLGSVSLACVTHLDVPVTVVHRPVAA